MPGYPREEALSLAMMLLQQLSHHCTRAAIAGSLRRGRPEVGDIELVCQPYPGRDMFAQIDHTAENGLDAALDQLVLEGTLVPGDKQGQRYRKFSVLPLGIQLDLFIVKPPAQYGVILLIRTGPDTFSKRFVTPRRHGGLLPSHLACRDGAIWDGKGHLQTPTEEAVFELIGMPYIEPGVRK